MTPGATPKTSPRDASPDHTADDEYLLLFFDFEVLSYSCRDQNLNDDELGALNILSGMSGHNSPADPSSPRGGPMVPLPDPSFLFFSLSASLWEYDGPSFCYVASVLLWNVPQRSIPAIPIHAVADGTNVNGTESIW